MSAHKFRQFDAHSQFAPEVHPGPSYPEAVKHAPEVIAGPQFGTWWPEDNSSASTAAKQKRTIYGLSPAVFWLAFALVGVIIVGTAVGGGVGGVLTAQHNQKLAAAQEQLSSAQSSATVAMASASAAQASFVSAYQQGFSAGQLIGGVNVSGVTAATNTASSAATGTGAAAASRTGPNGAVQTGNLAAASVLTPTSDCMQRNGTDYVTLQKNPQRFTRLCGTKAVDGDNVKTLYQGVVVNFNECIELCDSNNAWWSTNTTNIASFNLDASAGPIGWCWCRKSKPYNYIIERSSGFDSAYLAGTFDRNKAGLG